MTAGTTAQRAALFTTPDLELFRTYLKSGFPGPHAYAVLLGIRSFDLRHLMKMIERGLPHSAYERLRRNVPLGASELADLVQLAPRTLTRRRQEGRLASDESDRLLRATRIMARAIALFDGDPAAAVGWLTSEQPALGGVQPSHAARTELGVREVENLIERLEQGVYS